MCVWTDQGGGTGSRENWFKLIEWDAIIWTGLRVSIKDIKSKEIEWQFGELSFGRKWMIRRIEGGKDMKYIENKNIRRIGETKMNIKIWRIGWLGKVVATQMNS